PATVPAAATPPTTATVPAPIPVAAAPAALAAPPAAPAPAPAAPAPAPPAPAAVVAACARVIALTAITCVAPAAAVACGWTCPTTSTTLPTFAARPAPRSSAVTLVVLSVRKNAPPFFSNVPVSFESTSVTSP